MDLEHFCGDEFINIPAEEWQKILAYIGKDKERKLKITTHLAELVERYPLPVPEVPHDKAMSEYAKLEAYINEVVDIPAAIRGEPYKYPVLENSWKWKNIGMQIADKFFLEERLQASHRRYRSPAAAWGDVGGRRTAFNALVALKKPHVDAKMVLTGFKLRLHIAGNFRPTIAKGMYDLFKSKRVLDFSAGYGGRFVGFWASNAEHYIGIDPNISLQKPYEKLSNWLQEFWHRDKSFEFVWKPAEDVDYSQFKDLDLVFTSPPYFDLERYSQEDTQSWKRYKAIDSWKEQFLFKTIEKVYPSVRKGGHIAINICDSPSHEEMKICDDLCDFAVNKLKMKPLPAIKMLLTNRPGNNIKPGFSRISEPIWLFEKV